MILQFLTFELNNTTYAINVFNIQEVLEYEEPLAIPCSSSLLKGIVRSRDTNIPILNLKRKFEIAESIPNKLTRIIVVEIFDYNSNEKKLYGLIADKVIEVIEIDESKLEKVPRAKTFSGAEFISSIISDNKKYTLVLDVDKIFSTEEISNINKVSKKTRTRKTTWFQIF